MDRWKREGLLSANNGLRNQVEDLIDAYQRQQEQLAEVYQQLDALRVRVGSSDHSVEVTVDASGVLTELDLTESALRRRPEELARLIIDAVQEGARRARAQQQTLVEPVEGCLDERGDLGDIMSEAPSLGDIRAYLRGDRNSSG